MTTDEYHIFEFLKWSLTFNLELYLYLSVYYKNIKYRITSVNSNIELLFTDYRHKQTSCSKRRAKKSSVQGKYNVMLPSSLIQNLILYYNFLMPHPVRP